jgi:ethanolamine utilization protein EutP (predicted NTPase)
MKPTEEEIKRYNLTVFQQKNFFELINISEKDYDVLVSYESNSDKKLNLVKFDERLSEETIRLIMKVATAQLQARIKRQKQWSELGGT